MPAVRRLPCAHPEVEVFSWTCDAPHVTVKERFVIGRLSSGEATIRCGRTWTVGPGALHVARVGDSHAVEPRGGPVTVRAVAVPRENPPRSLARHLDPRDPRAAQLHRLIDAAWSGASRLELEVALTELLGGLDAFEAPSPLGRALSRVLEAMRDDLAAAHSLDALASLADVSKFQLCRAFRARLGLSPYAYLTRLRVVRAKQLLARGVHASEVAAAVGFCDQSQLSRHFRKLLGTTPGRLYAART